MLFCAETGKIIFDPQSEHPGTVYPDAENPGQEPGISGRYAVLTFSPGDVDHSKHPEFRHVPEHPIGRVEDEIFGDYNDDGEHILRLKIPVPQGENHKIITVYVHPSNLEILDGDCFGTLLMEYAEHYVLPPCEIADDFEAQLRALEAVDIPGLC